MRRHDIQPLPSPPGGPVRRCCSCGLWHGTFLSELHAAEEHDSHVATSRTAS